MNFEKDLETNEYDLINEWKQQPVKHMQYIKQTSKKKKEMSRLKLNIDVVRDQAWKKYKQEASDKGSSLTDKATEAVDLDRDVIRANHDYYDAVEEHDNLKGAVECFQDRKNGLQDMVDLFKIGYFSQPTERQTQGKKDIASIEAKNKYNQKRSKGNE